MISPITVVAFAAAIPGLCAQDAPFRMPEPPRIGRWANVLGDRVDVRIEGTSLRADGRIGGDDVHVDAKLRERTFVGQAKVAAAEVPCRGEFAAEQLLLRLGEVEWRLSFEVALDPSLAALGDVDVDDQREWTVAIYMGGDNNLEDAAVNDLLEMQRGMPATGVEVVVLLDRFADPTDGENDWSDTKVLRVRPGSDGSFAVLGEPKERDTGDVTTFASFVTGVMRRFPARHHAVVVWDHGGAWTGVVTDENPVGSGRKKTMLSLPDVRSGLRTALQASGLLQLDLLVFDACMMGQLEVALAVHDLASHMVGSEAIVPGTGLPYARVLPKFGDTKDAREIAKTIVREYGAFSEDEFDSRATLCAFDLAKMPRIAARLDDVAKQALAAAPQQWQAIARALFYAEGYEVRSDRVADDAAASIDLVDLSSRLRGIPGIADEALDVLQLAIASSIVERHDGAERSLSKGLSIYGPCRAGQFRDGYERSPLGDSTWRRLLAAVHERAARDTSEMTIGEFRHLDALGKPSTTAMPFGGDRVLFAATGDTIVEVQAHTWRRDDDGKQWLLLDHQLVVDPMWPARWATAVAADMIDLVMPQFRPGKNELFHELVGLRFVVTDGTLQTLASIDMATASTQAPVTALARYTKNGTTEPQLVEVSFDRAEWNCVSVRPIASPGEGAIERSVVPGKGDRFEFAIVTLDDTGKQEVAFAPALTWGEQRLALLVEPDHAGRCRMQTIARTIGGRSADAAFEFDVADNPDLAAWSASWKDFDPTTLVGTWSQFKVTGPQQYQDLKMTCEVTATNASNIFRVHTRGGPTGDEFETNQFWSFEWRSLPCLRVITEVADGQKFGWYGPARVDVKDGHPVLMMKAVNASGVVWEWRKQ